jgi:hypothetical protein
MPSNHRRFATLRDAFAADRRAAEEAGLDPINAMAEAASVKPASVYKWIELTRGMPLVHLGTWARVTRSEHALRWLMADWGFTATKRRQDGYSVDDLVVELPEAIQFCSDVFSTTAEALADGEITGDELRKIASRASKAGDALAQLVQSAEAARNTPRVVNAKERF